ncbi:hypothetical protein ScPMuIL_014439 [Solemya velum]
MNSQWLVIILVLTCMILTVFSNEIYHKCSDDLWGCRKKTCKSVRGKKHHHWLCLTLCWADFQICMSQLNSNTFQRFW